MKIIFAILAFALVAAADEVPEVDEKGIKDLIKKMREAINTGEQYLLKIKNIPGAEGIVERIDEATDELEYFIYHLKKAQRQCRKITDADFIRCRRVQGMYYSLYKNPADRLIESIENDSLTVIPLLSNSASSKEGADKISGLDEKGIKDLIRKMRAAINTGEKHLLKINNIPGAEGIVERIEEATDELASYVYNLKKAQRQCRKVTDADRTNCRRVQGLYYSLYKNQALQLFESIENGALRIIPLPSNSAS